MEYAGIVHTEGNIDTGCYRRGEMQVVSGPMEKEKVHFQAPSAEVVEKEMAAFLAWLNSPTEIDDEVFYRYRDQGYQGFDG